MKVVILWQYLFHYRKPFYDRLGRTPNIDLTVLHGGLRGLRTGHGGSTAPGSFQAIEIRTRLYSVCRAVIYVQTGLWRHILKGRFDVIICEGNFGMISNVPLLVYGRLTGRAVLFWAGGWERGRIRGVARMLREWFIRAVAHLPSGYLCYGSSARNFLVRYGVNPARCTIVQNAIDTEAITACLDEARAAGGIQKKKMGLEGKTVFLTVGELRPEKRVGVLLQAFKRLRATRGDVCLVVVGEGSERVSLERAAREVPDVRFVGEVIEGVAVYFGMADVFVLPGDGGLAINEAMAYGLPVVCSTADGTEQDLVVEGLSGLFFRRDDVAHLTQQLESLTVLAPAALKELGERARMHVSAVASLKESVHHFADAVKGHERKSQSRPS